MISSGVIKQNVTQRQDSDLSSLTANDTTVTLSSSSYIVSLYAPLYRPPMHHHHTHLKSHV